MSKASDIRFEYATLDEAKNLIISGNYNLFRTHQLPIGLDNSLQIHFGEKTQNQDITMKIIDKDDLIIGLISICDLDFKNSHCQINLSIGKPDSQIINNVIGLILKHCKNKLNLKKVSFLTIKGNPLEIELLNSCFEKEATLKQHKFDDGLYADVIWYSHFFDVEGVK